MNGLFTAAVTSPLGDGTVDWGFGSSDVWQTSMMIVGSVSGFLLLGIVVKFAPKIFGVIRSAVVGGGK